MGSVDTESPVVKYFLSKFQEGELVWVKGSKETVWDLGKVVVSSEKNDNDTLVIKTKKGRDIVTDRVFGGEDISSLKNKTGYGDMTAMRFVNEPQILENLRVRSLGDLPYTFMGPVLVAVNPLQRLSNMEAIKPGNKRIMSTAHPFAIAELSLQQMLFTLKRGEEAETPVNQTVIVSGESGSGKTVSSKLVLQHLVARSGGGDLAAAMLGSNPITESFGNSKTLRNPNSSRFGKMFNIMYNEEGKAIVGASIGTYLLERSRITKHELGERNFHVLYEILAGGDKKLLKALSLDPKGAYKCLLPNTKVEAQRVVSFLDTDKQNYDELIKSLKLVGFEGERLERLLGTVAAVLHLSSVEFEGLTIDGNDASKVNDKTKVHLDTAAELLGIAPVELEKLFTEVERSVAKKIIKSSVSAFNANQFLEGFNKSLYARIFQFMIVSVNQHINKHEKGDLPCIGVLDIFGFETFQRNDLEQLLINYTNEALQLTFNKQVLEAEAALYEREKLAMSEQDRQALDPSQVVDQSNKLCIELLQGVRVEAPEGKKSKKPRHLPGILDVVHEQGRVPGPSEKKMLDKLHKTFSGKNLYPNYLVIRKKARSEFIIKHYAGKVTYTVGNFLLKNADFMPKKATEIILSSTKELVKAVWDAGANLLKSKKDSIVSSFKKQIAQLNIDLNATQCSFIRCIKPNAAMHRNKGWFDKRYITSQLRNLSVPKTADVLKAGLPTRIAYDQLVDRYRTIFAGQTVKVPALDDERGIKSFIAALFYAFETPRSCYKLGLTKVFFKSGDLDRLDEIIASAEAWSDPKISPEADAERTKILERYKSYYVQRRWKVIFATFFAGRMFIRLLEAQRAQKELERKSAIIIQKTMLMYVQRKKYLVMLHEKKLEEERIAREKAEAERKEKARLAEIARQKELEKQRQLREFFEKRKQEQKAQRERFAKLMEDSRKANKAAAELRELQRVEKERRDEEERKRKEEAEKQRLELERLRKEREEQERLEREAEEKEREAKRIYEEKLRLEAAAKEAERIKKIKDEEERKRIEKEKEEMMQYMAEKMKEKELVTEVVDELMGREEERQVADKSNELLEDENPWFIYEDLDIADLDNISHDSRDEQRINDALAFLDGLSDDDDSSDEDSDLESREDDRNNQLLKNADKSATAQTFKDYNGPFIVNVHMPKLQENSLGKKKRFGLRGNISTWKQCFAFIYPSHKRVLLHQGTNKTIKVEFNSKGSIAPAGVKEVTSYGKKSNVLYVVGVRYDTDGDKDVSRDMIISFQDFSKREQFAKLLSSFVPKEGQVIVEEKPTEPKEKTSRMKVGIPAFRRRGDKRDQIRKQNYMRFALLNKGVKKGVIKKEQVKEILLQDEDEDDYDDAEAEAVRPCIQCQSPVGIYTLICPRCGAVQPS